MYTTQEWPISVTVHVPEPMEARMRDLEQNGIRYIELSSGDVRDFEGYRESSRQIFQAAAEHHVRIRSVHLPFAPFEALDPASTESALRERWLRETTEILNISAERGAEIIVVHPSGEPYREELRSEHLRHSLASIAALSDVAERAGVKLAVENLPRTCICRDCKELEIFAHELPQIFFCFDSNHSLIDQNTEIIRSMGERILALHISDYDFVNERHLFPGEGCNDWSAIIRTLKEIGYSGTWNYEIRNSERVAGSAFVQNYQTLFRSY